MFVRHRLAWLAGLIALVALVPMQITSAHETATVPQGFTDSLYADNFAGRLTSMTFGPDGRLYVSQKEGRVRIVDHGALRPDAFLTVPAVTDGEKGLKGIAFDPNYASTGFVYVYYTNSSTMKNRVSRFTRIPGDPNHTDAATEKVLVDGIGAGIFHSGGSLHFGPDGKLYISTGDASYAPSAQGLGNLDGKMLRINPDGTIPADNPFVGLANKKAQIWAYGLRNPFTFAFSNTGKLYINDVGEAEWEEIDVGARGANYGWPTCEGVCHDGRFVDPIYAYSHESGPGRSITGGVFYEASQFPATYSGDFFFGDYVGNYIKRYDPATGQVSAFATNAPNPVDLDVGPDGALYYLSVEDKEVHRISYSSSGGPTPTPTPTPPPAGSNLLANGDFEAAGNAWLSPWRTIVRNPVGATFTHATNAQSGAGSFRADLVGSSADWYAQLVQPGVALAAGHEYTLTFAAMSSAARSMRVAFQKNTDPYPIYFQQSVQIGTAWQTYSVKFTPAQDDAQALFAFNFGNAAGRLLIDNVVLMAATGTGAAPVPVISEPAAGSNYMAGQIISFAGSASDPEDGPLPASALTWEVMFHHDTHTHPFVEPFSGASDGAFTVPTTGEVSPNTWYRIHLTATDSSGNKTEITRDIKPLTANVTLATSPSGLSLTLNGIPVTAPNTFKGVVGFQRELGAPATQVVGGKTYRFVSWSDGGAATHNISTPAADTTYTAVYALATTSASLIDNGGFEAGGTSWLEPWRKQVRSPATGNFVRDASVVHGGSAALKVAVTTGPDWYVQLIQPGVSLTAGAPHTLTFWAKSTISRRVRVAFQQNSGTYPIYFARKFSLSTRWTAYSVTFTPTTSDPQALFVFNFGGSASRVWIDDVKLTAN